MLYLKSRSSIGSILEDDFVVRVGDLSRGQLCTEPYIRSSHYTYTQHPSRIVLVIAEATYADVAAIAVFLGP